MERVDGVSIEGSIIAINQSVMTVDPHRPVVMRDWKGKDLPVEFLLPLHISEEFDDSSDRDCHTVGILSIRNVQCRGTALDLAR